MCVVCRAAGLGRSHLLRGVWFYVIMFWCDLVSNVFLLFYLLFGQVVLSGWQVFF